MITHLFKDLNSPLAPIPTGLEAQLPQLTDIQAVIFDIYGTLVISGTGDISIAEQVDREEVLRSFLTATGSEIPLDVAVSGLFYGLIKEDHQESKARGAAYPEVDILEIWDRLISKLRLQAPDEETLKVMAIRFECAVNPVWPMPGLVSVLESLRKRQLPLGIVSNAQFYTPVMLESFTGKTLTELGFQKDLSVWSYKERLGKPSVELFQKLNRSLSSRGIQPEQTLYVGNDMLNDIWTANQAGLKTALFAGDKRSLRLRDTDERCQGLEPDLVITELAQLFHIL